VSETKIWEAETSEPSCQSRYREVAASGPTARAQLSTILVIHDNYSRKNKVWFGATVGIMHLSRYSWCDLGE